MAEQEYVVVYAAAYPTVAAARAVLDTIEHLHGSEVKGTYDAAVIDKENGKPHVVKRMDRPLTHIIPEWFGGGPLNRKERTSTRQGVHWQRQGRQARDRSNDRPDHQRAARSVQRLTGRAPRSAQYAWASNGLQGLV